ncbi:hypothetical protein KCU65_g7644, partial [Aureobasidium melanogenum]
MFIHSLVPLLFCFSAQLVSVSSSPLVERAASTCSANDIATVKRTAPVDPVYFCQWWQQDVRTRSPFMEFTPTQVDTLCKCISPIATTGPKCKRRRKRSEIEERAADPNAGRSASSCSAEYQYQEGHIDEHEEVYHHKHYKETIDHQFKEDNIKHKTSYNNKLEEVGCWQRRFYFAKS